MSCLNLRFPPAKKAWQSLTSKFQKHLHKLNKSKNMKKTRHKFDPFPSPSTKSVTLHHSPVLFAHKKKKRLFNPFKPKKSKQSLFSVKKRKKTAPVYIDNLFIGPAAQEVVVKCPTRAKTMKVREMAEKQEGEGSERNRQADDTMWESLGFGSPLMEGIDERAERFIASFRAEMEVQEIIDSQCNDDDSS